MSALDDLSFDPSCARLRADPYPTLAGFRRRAPVVFNPAIGGWMLTRYDDVYAALRDPRLSSDRISPFMRSLPEQQRERMRSLRDSLSRWSVFVDPPLHGRLRGLFRRAFVPSAIAKLRARIEALAVELVDEMLARGRVDFIDAFAYPFPALVICELLGLPREDIGAIREWSDDIATFIGLPSKSEATFEAALAADQALSRYFGVQLELRRRERRDDLIARLLTAADQSEGELGEAEVIASCGLLLFAAHTTTTHLLGNGLLALLRTPEQLALLRAGTVELGAAVEELLRFDGPIQTVRRVALSSLRIRDQDIAAGELVFTMIIAANRDPERFADPDRLNLRRKQSKQIAFGVGPHVCAGAALARMEAEIALRALLLRPGVELSLREHAPSWSPSFGFRGLTRLEIQVEEAGS